MAGLKQDRIVLMTADQVQIDPDILDRFDAIVGPEYQGPGTCLVLRPGERLTSCPSYCEAGIPVQYQDAEVISIERRWTNEIGRDDLMIISKLRFCTPMFETVHTSK